jgi:hypothetical protein
VAVTKKIEKNILVRNAKYLWEKQEPINWEEELDSFSTDGGKWRELAHMYPSFLGGTGYGNSVGSGAIIMYWREVLRKSIEVSDAINYQWYIITRSDFFWKVSHPPVDMLDERHIYLLDGELYGGFSDRHIIFHRRNLEKILSFATPIFQTAHDLALEIPQANFENMGPEVYLLFIARKLGLEPSLKFIPYLGFTIRRAETATRWAEGEYDAKLNLYVKYAGERRKTAISEFMIKSEKHWEKILNGRRYLRFVIVNILQAINTKYLMTKSARSQ